MVKKIPVYEDVVCPFCSLLCDDLAVENRGDRLAVLEGGCDKSRRGFESPPPDLTPLVDGRPVALDEAIGEAAAMLKQARRPLISGMACDVAGSRAAMLLAEKSGAVIDHGQGDAAVRNLLALQESGWIMTTLTELKNRADFVLFLGTDAVRHSPRFFDRLIWNRESLFLKKKNKRKIAYIGQRLNTRPGTNPSGERPVSINCDNEELIDYVTLLTGLIRGQELKPASVSRQQMKKVQSLVDEMTSCKYGVIIWSPADLDVAHGELVVQSIADLIRLLNESGRFAGLSLGGDNGGASFMNVCTWQSGFPLRVDYGRGAPQYDPYGHATNKLLEDSLVDTLLWIAAWDSAPRRPETKTPSIVLSCTPDESARVYIPVGVPGVDHAGNLFRTDSVVNLPLRAVRDPVAESTADVLARLTGTLSS